MNGKVKNAMAALLLVAAPLATQAKQWSLKDCIDYALANNISLQKTQLTKASAQEEYQQSKAALLPSLSASTNQSVNYTPWVASGISGDGFSRASIDKVYYNGPLMAWMVGSRPEKPTMEASTISIGSACTISQSA